MRKNLVVLAGVALSSCLVCLASPSSPSVAAGRSTANISPAAPIEHVVIIYQENHSFDDVLGQYCQTRENPCDGYSGPVTFADGVTAPNITQPDIVPAVAHTVRSQQFGMHNKWNHVGGCQEPPHVCVSHVDPKNIPNLASLADKFTVSDATFAAGHASSFGAHVTLGGGTSAGFFGDNPKRSRTGEPPGEGWGCSSHLDALWGPIDDLTYQPSCIPDKHGNGPYRESLVPYARTIMQRVEQAGLSWHIYEGDHNEEPLTGPWSVCTYFAWCLKHRFTNEYDSNRADFLTHAAEGTLPNLSILLPTQSTPIGGISQHNGESMKMGDNYIGDLVGAVMHGPQWKSTAIFITYDDCGCFYDHVTPPSKKMGLRNPMVIISPWAKRNGVDSTPAIQPYSALAFTEHVFGLRSLSPEVDEAYDYANSFDFSQQPLLVGPRMVHSFISQAEIRRLARLAPLHANDPA